MKLEIVARSKKVLRVIAGKIEKASGEMDSSGAAVCNLITIIKLKS